jgi:hypothetical protein
MAGNALGTGGMNAIFIREFVNTAIAHRSLEAQTVFNQSMPHHPIYN